jgi:sulfotransferase
MIRLFYNSSMPRSGSELLQVILHQNPEIYASATSPLLEYQFAARGNLGLPEVQSQDHELMEIAFLSMCRGMAESYYRNLTNRPYIIDKNRGWSHYWEWVDQWNPTPKMICMVRDLRAVVASFERIYRKSRHLPVGPDNPAQIQNMTVAERAQYWLGTQPIGLALKRTADLFQRGLASKILFVRYEDLCNRPEETMGNVYRYLGLKEFTHDFGNLKKEVVEDDSVFGPYGSHHVAPFLTKAKSNWNEVLEPAICKQIVAAAPWFFKAFEYEV